MSNEEYRVTAASLAASMICVGDAKGSLRSAQASLQSAGFLLEREEKRLGKLVFPLEGRKSFAEPINMDEAKKNDAALDLINAEREAAADKESTYLEALKHIDRALEALEE